MPDRDLNQDKHRVIYDGRLYEPRRAGALDMLVSRDGEMLAFEDGSGRRLPDGEDLDRLRRHGRVEVLPAAPRFGGAAKRTSLKRVRVLEPDPDGIVDAIPPKDSHRPSTAMLAASSADPRRVGPVSPTELADAMTAIMSTKPAQHPHLSVRGAYLLYLAAIANLNEGLGDHPVRPATPEAFSRAAAIAAFFKDASNLDGPRADTKH